ncbi:MAG: hypothetical protein AUH31_07695 [Armatimonadetes bacterium 13_1_40CM_64_14]|nr:MAG: hypothetical protein AUH31_07695 [Armatimonadetes bacterium 13_1_40CM_64_14]
MTAARPFEFVECLELREMLGRTAWDERELLAGIEDVPAGSIAYHTRSYFLRSRYLAAPYPNDFATWAAIQIRDRVLGERLTVVDPFDFSDIEQLRAELVTIIDHHLTTVQTVPRADYGEPFHFMRSVLIEVPTGISVTTLRAFRDGLERVDTSAIYYHFYESHRRPEADPLAWLQTELGRDDVVTQMRRLNPYVTSLAGMRAQLLTACDTALGDAP